MSAFSLVVWLLMLPLRVTVLPLLSWVTDKVQDRLMAHVYSSEIVFSTAWEDPRVDQKALNTGATDRALIITSAGCNALSLAIDGFERVFSVDKNPAQNAVLELKIASIRELDYDTFWKMWGEGKLPGFKDTYYPQLRPHLSSASREFWDRRPHYFEGTLLRNSFYFFGCSGVLACIVRLYAMVVPGLHAALLDLLEAKTLEEQRDIYYNRIEHRFFNRVLMAFLCSEKALSILNGVPKSQRDLLATESGFDSVGHFIRDSMETVMAKLPIHDNYFYRVYLTGSYTKTCCPEYMTPEGFRKLKAGAVDAVSVHTCFVAEFLEQYERSLDITHYFLLDHMDWMAQAPALLAHEWQCVLRHADPQRCRFLWRSASLDAEFVGETLVEEGDKQVPLSSKLRMHKDLADTIHQEDRVHTYTSFHIADLVSA